MSNESFFCPAPWMSMYYHENTASPCHVSLQKQKMSPQEYLDSDWLRQIKCDMKNGIVPDNCKICYDKESRGLKSTRQSESRDREGRDPLRFPNNYVDPDFFAANDETSISRLELRSSNLCNFKCRMCNSDSSSEWQKEIEKFPSLKKLTVGDLFTEYSVTSSDNFDHLKTLSLDNCRLVCFTGGEPLLIKHYYEFMDHMIEKGYNETVGLEFFTNCSVWNPLFIDRIMMFKEVRVIMSIDAYGKTAEYQRHGTDWKIVEENILKFVKLPKRIFFNSAISAYTLLDFHNHAKFLMRLYEANPNLGTRCYSVTAPFQLHFVNLNEELRARALEEIDKSLEILTPSTFDIMKKELNAIKNHIMSTKPERPDLFVSYTKALDLVRNEKFQDVFGYKLY